MGEVSSMWEGEGDSESDGDTKLVLDSKTQGIFD